MASAKTLAQVMSVTKLPNDTISKMDDFKILHNRVNHKVQRGKGLRRYVVAYLPANTSSLLGNPNHFRQDQLVKVSELSEIPRSVVSLSQAIGWRSEGEIDGPCLQQWEDIEAVS